MKFYRKKNNKFFKALFLVTANDQSHILKMKHCAEVIAKCKRNYNAGPFVEPVDAEKLGLADYNEIVKNPMDLQTMQAKLQNNAYNSVEEVVSDFKLMISNCHLYNGKDSQISKMADSLLSFFMINLRKKPAHEIAKTNKHLALMKECLEELQSRKNKNFMWPFYNPVENVPNYHEIIKKPMDLSTISLKIEEYTTLEEFKADLKLISDNCFTFNPKDTDVYECGQKSLI